MDKGLEPGIGEFENGSPQSHVELMYIKVTRCLLVLACTAVCTEWPRGRGTGNGDGDGDGDGDWYQSGYDCPVPHHWFCNLRSLKMRTSHISGLRVDPVHIIRPWTCYRSHGRPLASLFRTLITINGLNDMMQSMQASFHAHKTSSLQPKSTW